MNYRYHIVTIVSLIILFSACPEPPDNGDNVADCPKGQLPCENNSTECCDVECPPGYVVGGADSTGCILDTTKHEAFWVADTLPGGDLYDAAIIDENNIWVVGYIETDSGTYNAAHWDGSEWKLIRIQPEPYLFSQYTSVFSFGYNEVWFGSTIVVRWNGAEFIPYGFSEGFPGGFYVNNIWGTSSSDIYFVGDNGSIVQYNGTSFERMESGTDIRLSSISGTDETNVWVSGYDSATLQTVLLHYDGNVWEPVVDYVYNGAFYQDRISGVIGGVYTDDLDSVWVLTHHGLYRCPSNTKGEGKWLGPDMYRTNPINAFKGTSHNDLFFSGAIGQTYHYNGKSFTQYPEIEGQYVIVSSDVTPDQIVLVGYTYSNTPDGIVIRGYR